MKYAKKLHPMSKNSLQSRLLLIVLSALVLVGMIMIASTTYAIRLVNTQVFTAYRDSASMYLNWIESLFEGVEYRLYGITAYEAELRLIAEGQKDNKTKLAQKKMLDFVTIEANSYTYMDGFFVFSPKSKTYIEGRTMSPPFAEKDAFCRDLFAYLRSGEDKVELSRWFPARMGGVYYFFRVVQLENTFVGAWVSAEGLLDSLDKKQDYVLFVTDDGVPMTSREEILTAGLDLEGNLDTCYFTKGYMVAGAPSPEGDFRMLILTKQKKLLSGLYGLYSFAVGFCILLVFLIPILIAMLRKWIVKPVDGLVAAMDKLKNGDLDVKLEETPSCGEFCILNDSFTDMARQIKKLKLDVYEETLRKQKTQLHFFQLQIHPHFFANTLNMIYNLAQVRRYDLIQELALNLSEYYRFSIKKTDDFITLREELDHLRRYLDIQKIRFGDQLQICVDADPLLLDTSLPPLTIEIFVENSIKYAMDMDGLTEIRVLAETSPEDPDMVRIRVEDNGPGFSEEMMEEILSGRATEEQTGCRIGIYNVQQRLWILYGENAQLSIENREPHGTLVDIQFPKNGKEEHP